MKKHLSLYLTLVTGLLVLASTSAFGQTSPGGFPQITIKNFGKMDDHYYRGGQPKKDDYEKLKALGINTIIDLQDEPTKYEKSTAESLGMKYINIPMDDAEYPSQASIDRFLKEINDPANGTMYVHCKGGKHRTGVTGAVYRFTKYGWDYNKAMTEMENYNFDTSWGRKVMKTFVIDYAAKMKNTTISATSTSAH